MSIQWVASRKAHQPSSSSYLPLLTANPRGFSQTSATYTEYRLADNCFTANLQFFFTWTESLVHSMERPIYLNFYS